MSRDTGQRLIRFAIQDDIERNAKFRRLRVVVNADDSKVVCQGDLIPNEVIQSFGHVKSRRSPSFAFATAERSGHAALRIGSRLLRSESASLIAFSFAQVM